MSIVSATLDTEEKTLVVSIDGKDYDDPAHISMSVFDNFIDLHLESTIIKVGDLNVQTRVFAAKGNETNVEYIDDGKTLIKEEKRIVDGDWAQFL